MSLFRWKSSAGIDLGSHTLHWAGTDSRGRDGEVWSAELYPERAAKEQNLVGDALTARLRALVRQAEKET